MRLKSLIAIALVIFIFAVGNIIAFGIFSVTAISLPSIGDYFVFMAAYSIFLMMLLVVAVNFLKDSFQDKSDIRFLLVSGIIVCIALAFAVTEGKAYNDKIITLSNTQSKSLSDADSIAQANDYYSRYTDYLRTQIQTYQNDSDKIRSRLALMGISASQALVQNPAQQDEEAYYQRPRRHHEDEEYDD